MKKKNGFTLIELIIVLIILSILFISALSRVEKNQNEESYTAVYPTQETNIQINIVENSFKNYVTNVFNYENPKSYCETADPDGDMRVLCSTMLNIDGQQQLIKAACLIDGHGCTTF